MTNNQRDPMIETLAKLNQSDRGARIERALNHPSSQASAKNDERKYALESLLTDELVPFGFRRFNDESDFNNTFPTADQQEAIIDQVSGIKRTYNLEQAVLNIAQDGTNVFKKTTGGDKPQREYISGLLNLANANDIIERAGENSNLLVNYAQRVKSYEDINSKIKDKKSLSPEEQVKALEAYLAGVADASLKKTAKSKMSKNLRSAIANLCSAAEQSRIRNDPRVYEKNKELVGAGVKSILSHNNETMIKEFGKNYKSTVMDTVAKTIVSIAKENNAESLAKAGNLAYKALTGYQLGEKEYSPGI